MSRGRAIGGHQRPVRGESDNWLTPPAWIEALGPFDLDPCCPPAMPWRTAARMIAPPEDGLAAEWRGRVWLNPPYSQAGRWLERLVAHGDGIACIYARVETANWTRFIWPRAAGVLFASPRPTFLRPDGTPGESNSGGPIALCAFGGRNLDVLRSCPIRGALVRLDTLKGGDTPLFPEDER